MYVIPRGFEFLFLSTETPKHFLQPGFWESKDPGAQGTSWRGKLTPATGVRISRKLRKECSPFQEDWLFCLLLILILKVRLTL